MRWGFQTDEGHQRSTFLTMPSVPQEADTPEEVRQESKPDLPELTVANLLGDLKTAINFLIFDHDANVFVIPVLLMVESIACKAIQSHVPYTEIDYTAYMEQIKIIQSGELNYDNIYGGTGPLVYPAGHVWIYRFMHWLTQDTKFMSLGQGFFGYLYVLNLAVVMLIYYNMQTPPWVIYLLSISKRLHSIYILRLFNDCFTTYFVVLTVLSLQYAGIYKNSLAGLSKAITNIGAPLLYSLAISIKMNALLYLPGFLLVTYLLNDAKLVSLITPLAVITSVQAIVGYEFLFNGAVIRDAYLSGAFNFKRKFLYEWTVNWRFLSEETFLDVNFHKCLLIAQLGLLIFFLVTKWSSPKVSGKALTTTITDALQIFKAKISDSHAINNPVSAAHYIAGVMMASNFIGVICSRSLHYQFLSWYAWTFPYLLYSSGANVVACALVAVLHEWCWNVYPSTPLSSGVLLGINLTVLLGYWLSDVDLPSKATSDAIEKESKKNK